MARLSCGRQVDGNLTLAPRRSGADLEGAPDNSGLQAALRVQLVKLLKRDPALLVELQALLPDPAQAACRTSASRALARRAFKSARAAATS
jgi:hypothetical protein